jgi:NAD(P)-dependent dehydrogenase (short-subunit alcohol dehydrogenase family)
VGRKAQTKFLITGATGATGGHAARQLLEKEHAVRVLAHRPDERSEQLQKLRAGVVFGDFLDFDSVRAALNGVQRAYFFHPISPGLVQAKLVEEDPAKLWSHYLLLVAVEEAFKNLKGDLAIRPIFHQLEARVEAHVFIAFLAYCLHVTLARRLHALAPGLTPRSVLEKFAAVQMIDVHLPTTDGRELLLSRYTEPEPELDLLLNKLKLELPAQPPPKITAAPALPSPL